MEAVEGAVERVVLLRSKVDALYRAMNPERADWADWLYKNHVFLVADKAAELAGRFGANADLARAAGMLHDIADAVTKRENPHHDAESTSIARRFLAESGFTEKDMATIIDAMEHHSCRGSDRPSTMEGKVMATADAVVHLSSDFYDNWIALQRATQSAEQVREKGLEKIARDFNVKIFFDEVREEMRPHYERLKSKFEAL